MCDKDCRRFGKCKECQKSKVERGYLICTIGDRRGTHGRCFTCKRLEKCKKAKEAAEA
ncbi:hypothetical protein [uncultured Dysosmobacter sp.]|uniref:hypothetical protein n=1 Tax=uncultured Dysosmobacter sp. TaxID=2591384 RepID=UPI00262D68D2|nr:hypothetical protein [uncultured Dysosmobacter sp.]